MKIDKQTIIEVLADLLELKKSLLGRRMPDDGDLIPYQPSVHVIEMLVAHFADKYKIKVDDIYKVIERRFLESKKND